MTTFCAPCLADLALAREAVTAVGGTAACMAHAVLLSHPGDAPVRRLARLSELRALAESKLETASIEEQPRLELLVQEYALAGAMDMTVPLKDLAGDRTKISFSAGVAQRHPGERLADCLARADTAMYGAKRAGRGRTHTAATPGRAA